MKNLEEILVSLSILIKDAIKRINSDGIQKTLIIGQKNVWLVTWQMGVFDEQFLRRFL